MYINVRKTNLISIENNTKIQISRKQSVIINESTGGR